MPKVTYTIPEICAKLRQDARDMRDILAEWPLKDLGNRNHILFARDAEIWDQAASLIEEHLLK